MQRLPWAFCLGLAGLCLRAQTPPAPPQQGSQPGWVVIPLKEYDALRAKAAPSPDGEDPSKLAPGAVLTRLDYDLRVDGSQAAGRATATFDILREGWFKVPLPAALHIREARLAGKPALVADGAAIFSSKGRYVLELELATPVTLAGGAERITLPASGSGVTHVAFTLNREGFEVQASGGAVSTAAPPGYRWLIHARGDAPLSLSWRRKVEEPPAPRNSEQQPVRQRGRLTEWLSLGEDATAIAVEAALEVTQGAARTARLAIPESVTVNQVQGAGVMDWERKGGEVVVTFLEPVPRQTQFVVQGETRLPREGVMDLPLVRLLDVERESGGVMVEAVGAAELKNPAAQGLERTDPAELGTPAGLARPSAAVDAFRFVPGAGSARSLRIEVARYTPQATLTAIVDEARYQALMSADGKTLVRARLAVRNNQRSFLRLTIPADAVLWSASVDGRPARPGQGPEASLLLPLSKANSGQEASGFAVEVTYLVRGEAWAADRGRAVLTLPKLDLPVGRSAVELFYPPRFRISAEPGPFRVAAFWPPASPVLLAVAPPPVAQVAPSPAAQQQHAAGNSMAAVNSQLLADQFRARRQARLSPGVMFDMAFPSFGPSVFLQAELTGDNREARIEFSYAKDKRGGEDR